MPPMLSVTEYELPITVKLSRRSLGTGSVEALQYLRRRLDKTDAY